MKSDRHWPEPPPPPPPSNALFASLIILGIVAGVVTTTSLLPFILKALVYPSNTSLKFCYMQVIGQCLWFTVGILGILVEGDGWIPLIVFSVINLALYGFYLWVRLRYDRNPQRIIGPYNAKTNPQGWKISPFFLT